MCSSVTAWPPRWQEQLILRQQPGFFWHVLPCCSAGDPFPKDLLRARVPALSDEPRGGCLCGSCSPGAGLFQLFPGCHCRREAEVFIHFTPHCESQAGCVWGSSGHSAVTSPCVEGSWPPGTGALHSVPTQPGRHPWEWCRKLWDEESKPLLE